MNATSLVQTFISFINNTLVPLVFAIAFIVFLWGAFQYFIAGASDEEKHREGRTFIIYSLLGFVLMVSIWGIVNAVNGTLKLNTQTSPPVPTVSQ